MKSHNSLPPCNKSPSFSYLRGIVILLSFWLLLCLLVFGSDNTILGQILCQLYTYISYNHTIVFPGMLIAAPYSKPICHTVPDVSSPLSMSGKEVSRYTVWILSTLSQMFLHFGCLLREKSCIWLPSLRFARSQLGSVLLAGSHGISCISLSA